MNDIQVSDTEMLDWLEKHTKDNGDGWICRESATGRGIRLHRITTQEAKFLVNRKVQPTVRKAIIAAIQYECEFMQKEIESTK